MIPIVEKVYAYIVQGHEIVIFEQPDYPEAGRQVPGGTVEPDEQLDDAVLREAYEETGLTDLKIHAYLGSYKETKPRDDREAVYHFHFYYLQCAAVIPAQWDHIERYANNSTEPIRFRFYRIPLDQADSLHPHFARFIDTLKHGIQTEDQG